MKQKDYDYCKNCKHFHQHYVNIKDVGIRELACGHCMENKMQFGCSQFEQNQNLNKQDINLLNLLIRIEKELTFFNKKLNELKQKNN